MIEGHLTADFWHFNGIFCILYRHRLIHRLKDTFQIRNVVDKVIEDVSKVHDRLPEIRCIARNRYNRTNRLISLPKKDQTGQKNGSTHADGN